MKSLRQAPNQCGKLDVGNGELGIGNWELGIGNWLTTMGCTSLSARTAIAVYAIPNYQYSKVYGSAVMPNFILGCGTTGSSLLLP
ncbi:MAG: hypothetical protein F6K47_38200 [Symploca sp. SIO2E6]|nr:hypothetical protein [Symploca sp. SIO2E6]